MYIDYGHFGDDMDNMVDMVDKDAVVTFWGGLEA
jgi:hypothetical protein